MVKIEYELDVLRAKQLVEALDDWMLKNLEYIDTEEIRIFAEYIEGKIDVAEE